MIYEAWLSGEGHNAMSVLLPFLKYKFKQLFPTFNIINIYN